MNTLLNYVIKSPKTPTELKVLKDKDENAQTGDPNGHLSRQQMIVLNMESVIKSLKKKEKHKRHHRHKKRSCKKQEEPEESGQSKMGANNHEVDEDDEPLSSLKKSLKAAPPSDVAKEECSNVNFMTPTKRDAFAMLMLNGKGAKDDAPLDGSLENGENVQQKSLKSKRKPDDSNVKHVKKRKVDTETNGDVNKDASGVANKNESPVKRKRNRKKLFDLSVETVECVKPKVEEAVVLQTATVDHNDTPTRPRRTCTTKIVYLDQSITPPSLPPSLRHQSARKRRNGKRKPSKEEPPVVAIEDDDEEEEEEEEVSIEIVLVKKSAEAEKLAPLFRKSLPRPAVDPEVIKARQSFLMSDLPDKLRNIQEKRRKQQEEVAERLLSHFPEISHVNQGFIESRGRIEEVDQMFSKTDDVDDVVWPTAFTLARNDSFNESNRSSADLFQLISTESRKQQIVRELKKAASEKFPAYLFYKMLAKKCKMAAKEMSIIDRLKPLTATEFLFNLKAVAELKNHLETFASAEQQQQQQYNDSEDELSNSVDMVGCRVPTMVLSGPSGTGKTSAVYAIANELNYNVIEINASERRNGARLLQQLLEATQSHKVPTASSSSSASRLSLSKKMLRKVEREEKVTSIILIEDVDVIFADDTGFLSAISQLMQLTKRPIILTTNNRNAPALRKNFFHDFNLNFKFLDFNRTLNVDDCVHFLYLMGVVQGCDFEMSYLRDMFEACGRDIRQAILHVELITRARDVTKVAMERVLLPHESMPCMDERKVMEAGGTLEDIAWTMDQLCVANTWTLETVDANRPALIDDLFDTSCRLGRRIMPTNDGYLALKQQQSLSNQVGGNRLMSKAMATEEEPILRAICRSERARRSEQRGTSRFYHYLQRNGGGENGFSRIPSGLANFGRSTRDTAASILETSCDVLI